MTPPGYASGGSTKDHPSDTLRVHIGHGGGRRATPGLPSRQPPPLSRQHRSCNKQGGEHLVVVK